MARSTDKIRLAKTKFLRKIKGRKTKTVPVSKHHATKSNAVSGSEAKRILNFGTRKWQWPHFTLRSLKYGGGWAQQMNTHWSQCKEGWMPTSVILFCSATTGKNRMYPLDRRLDRPQIKFERESGEGSPSRDLNLSPVVEPITSPSRALNRTPVVQPITNPSSAPNRTQVVQSITNHFSD